MPVMLHCMHAICICWASAAEEEQGVCWCRLAHYWACSQQPTMLHSHGGTAARLHEQAADGLHLVLSVMARFDTPSLLMLLTVVCGNACIRRAQMCSPCCWAALNCSTKYSAAAIALLGSTPKFSGLYLPRAPCLAHSNKWLSPKSIQGRAQPAAWLRRHQQHHVPSPVSCMGMSGPRCWASATRWWIKSCGR